MKRFGNGGPGVKELAKSAGSFFWALSLFGGRQLLNVMGGAGGRGRPAAELGAVTRAAAGQLPGTLRNAFEAGEQVQRSAVDLAVGVLTLEALDPNRFVALSSSLVQRSTAAARRLVPGGTVPPEG